MGSMDTARVRANVELPDRLIRIAIGFVLLAAIALVPRYWFWLLLVASFPLASGLTGWCPLYAWLMRD